MTKGGGNDASMKNKNGKARLAHQLWSYKVKKKSRATKFYYKKIELQHSFVKIPPYIYRNSILNT